MRAKGRFLTAFVAIGAVYLGYPYATLYRLNAAVRGADAATLDTMVDWYSVREGLKEDICDYVTDEPSGTVQTGQLPAFGAGFVRGIANGAVDRAVSSEAVVAMARDRGTARTSGDTHVEWAFFNSPTRFLVNLHADGAAEPIRVTLEFRHMRWQVRRVWLPGALLERAGAGT